MSRTCVMASGAGTNLEAILLAGERVALVIVDCECRAKQIAERYGIPVRVIARRNFNIPGERELFTVEILAALFEYRIDLVAMAGFMTILAKQMFRPYPEGYGGRILNAHPAPLRFKGGRAVRDVLIAYKGGVVRESAVTIHEPEEEVDTGRVLYHIRVPIYDDDTEQTLHARTKVIEHLIYPRAIRRKYRELGLC